MSSETSFTLNGAATELAGAEPTESLLRWLKRRHLTGTKEGCADGDCGACTVALVETGSDGKPHYQAINSCLLPIGFLPGREVLTVEALAQAAGAELAELHPVQRALVDSAGSQCGYCTPGFVMSLFAGYYANEFADDVFEGNLCRCTGYQPIRVAAAALAAQPKHAETDRFARAIEAPRAALPSRALARFHSPATLNEALALKREHPEATWIAGATDLGVNLSHHQSVAPAYIALDRITALKTIEVEADRVVIGAGVTLSRLETELHGMFRALDRMLPWFAGRQVRNRATLGGNLGSASPIGDLLPVLLAHDASVLLVGPRGPRAVAIGEYFHGYRKTARAPDELIVAVKIPRRARMIETAYKVAKRQTDDISIVAAAFALELDAARMVTHVRLAYGGVAAVPLRARKTEALLLGARLDAARVEAASESLRAEFEPLSDHRAGAAYRRALAGNFFARFVAEECQ